MFVDINKWRLFGFLFLFVAGLSLSACNTMEGAGEDIQDAGESIEDAAD